MLACWGFLFVLCIAQSGMHSPGEWFGKAGPFRGDGALRVGSALVKGNAFSLVALALLSSDWCRLPSAGCRGPLGSLGIGDQAGLHQIPGSLLSRYCLSQPLGP